MVLQQNENYKSILFSFIERSEIPKGWKNEGFNFAGFIQDTNSWCLPSWIWTSSALIHVYFLMDLSQKAIDLSNKFLDSQKDTGGWVVRWDLLPKRGGLIPIMAPNDSAYIARNALLTTYIYTNQSKFLEGAIKCAEWIIDVYGIHNTVPLGFDELNDTWIMDNNIVDVFFTIDLFSELYQITQNKKYLDFAKTLSYHFIDLFYLGDGRFSAAINSKRKKVRGLFTRGHAWVLEGLIPYYEISKDLVIKNIIDNTVSFLLKSQKRNGGWLYNSKEDLTGFITGYDSKGGAAIAYSLYRWSEINSDFKNRVNESIIKSIKWHMKNTIYKKGKTRGGVFSYSFEGAVSHTFYSKTAFVYTNAYLIRLLHKIESVKLISM